MKRFRVVLPVAQSVVALILGGIGEWQRRRILNRVSFFGDGWHSTARFHVWPWPLKFAVITTMPTTLPGALLSIGWENISDTALFVVALLSGPIFWYWIGSRFDRRWTLTDRKPWIVLSIFNLIAFTASLLDLGTVGYIWFGFVLWIFWVMTTYRLSPRVHKKVGGEEEHSNALTQSSGN